jgi:hypothetical protein
MYKESFPELDAGEYSLFDQSSQKLIGTSMYYDPSITRGPHLW